MPQKFYLDEFSLHVNCIALHQ